MRPPSVRSVPRQVKEFFLYAAVGLLLGVASPDAAAALAAAGQAGAGAPVQDGRSVGAPVAERGPEGDDGDDRRSFPVRRTEAGVVVDGRLDERAWAAAAPVPLLFETDPGDNTPAPVETVCFLSYDEDNLYFGCRARDPHPDRIRAWISDRDDVDGQDRVVLTLDPFNDARRAFEFGVTPLGVQLDRTFDESSGEADDSWDTIWRSAGRISDGGYVVEAAIPFPSLRFPDNDAVQTWGFYARRAWPRSEDVETRSMRWDRGRACQLCQANLATGIQGVSTGMGLELSPTLTARRTDRRASFPDGELATGPGEAELGVDARWSPATSLALNATVNPDFSQVEADVPQLDANRRFALFFPEQRPFFLEGADIFRTPIQAVFTRTVADPSWGAKLTGKLGSQAVGVMVTRDETTQLLLPASQGSDAETLDRPVTSAVGRYRRDVGTSHAVGALYAGRIGEEYENHVMGTDLHLQPLSSLTLRAQYLHSVTDDADELARARGRSTGSFVGDAARLEARLATRSWNANLNLEALSPGFRADAGFVPRVDVQAASVWGGHTWWGGEEQAFTSLRWDGGTWRRQRWSGQLGDEGLWTLFEYAGPWQSAAWVNPEVMRQAFAGQVHELTRLWHGVRLRPSGAVSLGYWGVVGDAVDFANAREARQLQANPSVELRLGRHLDLSASFGYQRLSLEGREILRASVSQLRSVYSFSPRAFVRATVQHRRTERNPALHREPVEPERTSVDAQLLFSYKVNPLTVLFVGYSDDWDGFTAVDRTDVDLTRRGRTFFVKLGYGWRP